LREARQDGYVGILPVVIAERFKESAVQERDAAVEDFAPGVLAAIRGERVVKEGFKDVVEKLL